MNQTKTFWFGLAIWATLNAWLLAEGLLNRRGIPQAILTIDECQLDIRYGDEPGIHLRSVGYFHPLVENAPNRAEAMALFGFDPERPPEDSWRTGKHAFVAVTDDATGIEGDGRPYASEPMPNPHAALVVFDAAPDAATLRDRYGNDSSIAVARGLVRIRRLPDTREMPDTGMTLAPDIRVSKLHLSLEQRQFLRSLGYPATKRTDISVCQPRFEVDVAWGNRKLAFIAAIRPLPSAARDRPADRAPGPGPLEKLPDR